MIHALGPPSEEEEGIAADTLAGSVHLAVEISILEKILAVLMLEDHPLPALHLTHPRWCLPVVPPSVHPITIDSGGCVPCPRIRRNHVGGTLPDLSAKAVRVLVEPELKDVILACRLIPVDTESVPCVLKSVVVRAEIESLPLSEESETVHEHLCPVLHVSLPEHLFGLLVRRRADLADGLDRVLEQHSSGLRSVEFVIRWYPGIPQERILELADDSVRLIVAE